MKPHVWAALAAFLIAGPALAAGTGQGAGQGAGNGTGVAPHFLENWDLDGDGQVTRDEARERRGDVFFMFDNDDNGALDSAEYDLFDETRAADMANAGARQGLQPRPNSPAALLGRDYTDADHDGLVTREEFMAATDVWFDRVDRNGDGVITLDDFGRRKN